MFLIYSDNVMSL